MELIPIIKYALTVVSILSVVIITVSYVMYKIKNSKKADAETGYNLVPVGNNNFTQNLPAKSLFDEKILGQKAFVHQVRDEKPRYASVKKSVKRFMVINENNTPYKFDNQKPLRMASNYSDDTNSRKGLDIYSNYSSNSSEPLKKFSL